MRHHLIALFALLSGLAAFQAPAHAAALEAAVHDARSGAGAHDNSAVQECAVRAEACQTSSKRPLKVAAVFAYRMVDTLKVPVLIGSDRALE